MNIEYDFENKKYETAITKIKATVMDIISEDMLSSKRNDKVLIDILKTMNELEKYLEELDRTTSNVKEVPKETKPLVIEEDEHVIEPIKKEDAREVVVPTVKKEELKITPQVKDAAIPTVKIPVESKDVGSKTTDNVKSTIIPTVTPNNQQVHFDFQKADNTPPKAIITSANQSIKLRKSLKTQEALVNFKSSLNGEKESSENSIEKMMNEAALLYKEGKAEEAQRMYDKISEMNRQIKSDPAKVNTLTMN